MQGTFQLIRSDMNFILSKRISLLLPGIILLSAKFTCQDYSKWRIMPHSCWILSRWKIKISRSFVVLRTRTKLIMLRLMPSDVTLRRNLNRINRYFEQTMSTLIEKGHLGDWSAEMYCFLRLTFRPPVRKPWSDPSDSNHPDDLLQSRYVTPWFKPFSYRPYLVICSKSQMFCICRVTRGNFEILTNLASNINKIGITRLRIFNIYIGILIIYLRDE